MQTKISAQSNDVRFGRLSNQRPFLLLVIILTTLFCIYLILQWQTAVSAEPDIGPVYGVNFISSAETFADEQQYQNGLATGAGWNRWPLYWFFIETNPGSFDWSRQDTAVQADIDHGLQTNAILLGTPGFYQTREANQPSDFQHPNRGAGLALYGPEAATPVGLYTSVFTDGDTPGPNKTINPDNKWAVFVAAAVNRYKPGGSLAQTNNWPPGTGVTHWEMWNEPDLDFFWDASLVDYARLLKVGYLAAKHADPQAKVMFGALANNYLRPDYYADVLNIYAGDALATDNGYFHDILATHSYFDAWKSWRNVWRVGVVMAEHDLDKDIWFNETGVPAWDDYPGPVWDALSPLRATMQEQADFTIQSAFFALYAGADAYFYFQLYDGCGNQPGGTDFPPHNGELCDENGEYNGLPCAGDSFGLFRNPTDAACFTQHPDPESPRPSFDAYQVLTTYLRDIEPYWNSRPGEPLDDPTCPTPGGPQEWIAFYKPTTQKRIVGMWARCGQDVTAVIEATDPAGTAQLIAPDGSVETLNAVDNHYSILLPKATNRNPFPGQPINTYYAIGGRPYILIETDYRDVTPSITNSPTASLTPSITKTPPISGTVTITPSATATISGTITATPTISGTITATATTPASTGANKVYLPYVTRLAHNK